MTKQPTLSTATQWARFRFSVIGSLLSAPLARGELKAAIQSLAERIWTHPVTGQDVQYAATTIEGCSVMTMYGVPLFVAELICEQPRNRYPRFFYLPTFTFYFFAFA